MERRYSEITVRALGNNKIGGVASVFHNQLDPGTQYNLWGNVWERIHPSAFEGVLRNGTDTLALFNHDPNLVLGRTPNTLKLWTSEKGLEYEVELDPEHTEHRNLYRSIERGDIKGSSFGAMIGFATWAKEGDKDVRTIMRVKRLVDVSPVAMPAYTSSTATLRSQELEALQLEHRAWQGQQETMLRVEKAQALLTTI